MGKVLVHPDLRGIDLPDVGVIGPGRPFVWLALGVRDLVRAPGYSLAFGLVFAGLGFLIVRYDWSDMHLGLTLTSGFLLVAPLLAIGLYDISRQIDQGAGVPSLLHALLAWQKNRASIGLFAVFLIYTLSCWERISAILVGLFLVDIPMDVDSFLEFGMFASGQTRFLVAYVLLGAIMAALVYAVSVVTLPMLVDREVDLATAMATSIWVVKENLWPMLLWAVLIVALVVIGYLAWVVGMVFVFPILGHASWHAYLDLVGAD